MEDSLEYMKRSQKIDQRGERRIQKNHLFLHYFLNNRKSSFGPFFFFLFFSDIENILTNLTSVEVEVGGNDFLFQPLWVVVSVILEEGLLLGWWKTERTIKEKLNYCLHKLPISPKWIKFCWIKNWIIKPFWNIFSFKWRYENYYSSNELFQIEKITYR